MDGEIGGTLAVAFGHAATAVKTIVETISLARDQVKAGKGVDDEKLAEAFDLAISLRTEILRLQDQAFRLQQERDQLHKQNVQFEDANAKLHQQLSEKEQGATERQKYQRKMVGGSVVLVREDEPDHFYCPTCMEARKHFIPLQPHPMRRGSFGSHFCSQCHTSYHLRG